MGKGKRLEKRKGNERGSDETSHGKSDNEDIEMLARAKKYKQDGLFIKDYDTVLPWMKFIMKTRIERELKKRIGSSKTDKIVSRANGVELVLKPYPSFI